MHREVFGGIPGPLKLVFYTVIPVMLVWGAWQFSLRVQNWERGGPDRRKTTPKNAKRRLADFRAGVYMRTLLRDPAAGIMHSMIYFGFLILLGVTTVLEIDHQLPESLKFLHGAVYQAYAAVGDAAGLVFTAGVLYAIVRRYVQRPYRIRIKTKPEHALILGVFLLIGLSGFAAEMFRIASYRVEGHDVSFEKWSFVGYPLSQLVDGLSESTLSTWHQAMWITHVLAFVVFLAILPITMLRHMFTSPLNMYLKDRERPEGRDEADAEPHRDVARDVRCRGRRGLHVEAAARHRRLHDVRALHQRLPRPRDRQAARSPRDRAQDRRGDGGHRSFAPGGAVSPPLGIDAEITIGANSLFERITAEEIWACTSCKACDEICPVNIEILDKILDMRRYLSLMESNFPTELGTAYRGMENQGNPWGMNQGERADWAKGLDDVTIVDPGEPLTTEYLYWVGCAGSLRRQEQEGHPVDGEAAEAGRHRRRDPRPVGDVHRRLRPPHRQRVPLPDAGDAEHRDARRHGREEDHHPVPALLQHAEERVPAARRQLRGRSTTASCSRT